MAETKQNLTSEEAYNTLVAQVHAPVFFEKLARVWGIQAQSQDEARELLLIAGQLRNAHEQNQYKQASAYPSNVYAEARRDLTNTISELGFSPLVDTDNTIKQAAEAAAQNPLIREAALTFNDHMSQVLQSTKN